MFMNGKSCLIPMLIRAFSEPFGKFFGTDEIGKKLCDFGKKYDHFGNLSAILSNIGKIYL